MKKYLLALFIGASLTATSQNSNLVSFIDPTINRGYMHWIGDGSTEYIVNTYEVNDSTRTLLISTKTTNNYIKFDPLLYRIPNLEFQILSLNSNGQVLQEGDFVINEICSDCEPATPICQIDCNGRSNAWRLTAYDKGISYGHHKFMTLTDAYQYYDEVQGFRVPYWQAFTTSSYANLGPNHPYRLITYGSAGGPLYLTRPIHEDLTSIHRDKDNFIVTEGFIVEKKLDQFSARNGQNSTAYHEPLCSDNVTANNWADFFEDHLHPSFGGSTPVVSNYQVFFGNGDELTCSPSGATSGGGVDYDFGTYTEAILDFIDCVEDSELPFSVPCDHIVDDFGGFILSSILDTTVNIRYKIKFDNLGESSIQITSGPAGSNAKIPAGLYNLTFYLKDGNALPTVVEIKKDIKTHSYSFTAKLEVRSNPIIDKELKFDLIDKSEVNKFVRIHDFYGNLVYSEDTNLGMISRVVDVSSFEGPLFILSVVFPDGSLLQETILK